MSTGENEPPLKIVLYPPLRTEHEPHTSQNDHLSVHLPGYAREIVRRRTAMGGGAMGFRLPAPTLR